MQTEMPFFDSPEDALKAIIQQLGGAKKVGQRVFPDKSVDAAARYLLDCVNPERSEKLAISQVMMLLRLAHEADYHAAYAWISADVGYDIKPITRAQEVDRVTGVVEQTTKTLISALAVLKRLQRPS